MFVELQDDIFKTEAEALVNPVNCVGVMGKGLALQFKERFPENFEWYSIACKKHKLHMGTMVVTHCQEPTIINLPTKRHWRDSSQVYDIEITLEALKNYLLKSKIKSVAIPALGCGLGGLNWQHQVRSLTYNILEKAPSTEKLLYLPQ